MTARCVVVAVLILAGATAASAEAARSTPAPGATASEFAGELDESGPAGPDVVVDFDSAGRPILPDLEAARRQLGRPRVTATDLTFTFTSPTYPWTSDELAALQDALGAFYPTAKSVYGNPAFSITLNVRKDPTVSYPGLYFASSNEMVLRDGVVFLDVLCHEMLHAFRDDLVIAPSSWEEAMTRAAELEVFARLPQYTHWDEHHLASYDVYYQALSTPEIGGRYGSFFYGYVSPVLRYQLGGYAWAKPLLEDPAFLAKFNAAYYAAAIADASVRGDEPALVSLAAASTPVVEGQSFAGWYAAQGVLTSAPPSGYVLYQRVNQYTIDYFERLPTGEELMQGNQAVRWAVYDHAGVLLDAGSGTTTANGWLSFSPALPPSYEGRIAVTATASSPAGPVESTFVRTAVDGAGVFGVVDGVDTGTVTVTPLDDPSSAVTAPVADGAFYAPALESLAGRFVAAFRGPGGVAGSLRFSKDAARYFVSVGVSSVCGNGTVEPEEDCDDGNQQNGDGCDDDAASQPSGNCTFSSCGNGVPAASEECDDGDIVDGDGCSAACTLEPCGPAPATGCRVPFRPGRAVLILKDGTAGGRDELLWKWASGRATPAAAFGTPELEGSSAYQLCIYDALGGHLFGANLASGGMCGSKPCWKGLGNPSGSKGYRWKDQAGTSSGLTAALLKPGRDGKARLTVSGRGMNLSVPTLPVLNLPLTVEMKRLDDPAECWQATYGDPIQNKAGSFKAKGD